MMKEYLIDTEGNEPFKMNLDPTFYADWALLQAVGNGQYPEPEVSALMLHVVKPGDTVVDAGANTGFYTCLLARLVGPQGRVIAFEPGTNNMPKLKDNIAANEFTNVTVEEKGLWSESGYTKFYLNADSGQNAVWSFRYSDPIEIEVTTLDKKFNGGGGLEPFVKLAKLDVEGAEEHVLRGMDKLLLSGYPQFITCEINPAALNMMGSSESKLREFMREFGYDTFALHDQMALPTLIPPKTKLSPRQLNTNVLFAKLDSISEYWPEIMIGPTHTTAANLLAK